jgi:hypothetical protein
LQGSIVKSSLEEDKEFDVALLPHPQAPPWAGEAGGKAQVAKGQLVSRERGNNVALQDGIH